MSLPPISPVEQLSIYVTRILGHNPGPFTLQGTNTYLVGHPRQKDRLLVDTSDGNAEYQRTLTTYLETNGLRITHVVVTHSHYDHILGANFLRTLAPNATFFHYKEAPHVEHDGFDPSIFEHWPDGERIEAAGLHFRGFFTPGHCDDHLSIWLEEANILFSGDNLLGHGSSVFNHYANYMHSLHRMRNLPGLQAVYPGHGSVVRDGKTAFDLNINHRIQRENEILNTVLTANRGISLEEIVEIVYGQFDIDSLRIKLAATKNTQQYLDKLASDHKICQFNGLWRQNAALGPVRPLNPVCT